jgi:hypothetical protein
MRLEHFQSFYRAISSRGGIPPLSIQTFLRGRIQQRHTRSRLISRVSNHVGESQLCRVTIIYACSADYSLPVSAACPPGGTITNMVWLALCLTGLRLSKAEKHSRWPASFPDVVWAGSGKYSIYLPNRSNFIVNTEQWLLLVRLTKCLRLVLLQSSQVPISPGMTPTRPCTSRTCSAAMGFPKRTVGSSSGAHSSLTMATLTPRTRTAAEW